MVGVSAVAETTAVLLFICSAASKTTGCRSDAIRSGLAQLQKVCREGFKETTGSAFKRRATKPARPLQVTEQTFRLAPSGAVCLKRRGFRGTARPYLASRAAETGAGIMASVTETGLAEALCRGAVAVSGLSKGAGLKGGRGGRSRAEAGSTVISSVPTALSPIGRPTCEKRASPCFGTGSSDMRSRRAEKERLVLSRVSFFSLATTVDVRSRVAGGLGRGGAFATKAQVRKAVRRTQTTAVCLGCPDGAVSAVA